MDTSEFRDTVHEEIKNVAQENADIKQIVTYTRDEADEKLGLTWTDLARIYFDPQETMNNAANVKKELEDKQYLVVFDEDDEGKQCLDVKLTIDVNKRISEDEEQQSD